MGPRGPRLGRHSPSDRGGDKVAQSQKEVGETRGPTRTDAWIPRENCRGLAVVPRIGRGRPQAQRSSPRRAGDDGTSAVLLRRGNHLSTNGEHLFPTIVGGFPKIHRPSTASVPAAGEYGAFGPAQRLL
jgi:hypothetical protein